MAHHAPVTIIGAGISCLSLAQILRSKGIPVQVFEKGKVHKRHIKNINSIALRLSTILPVFKAMGKGYGRLNGEAGVRLGRTATTGVRSRLRVDPTMLKELLRAGLIFDNSDAVASPEKSKEGLTLAFANGKKVKSACTVAGDHTKHPLRASLVPRFESRVLPFVVRSGNRWFFESNAKQLWRTFKSLGKHEIELKRGDVVLQAYVNGVEYHEGEINLSYTFSRPVRPDEDPLFDPNCPNAPVTDTLEEYCAELEAIDKSGTVFDIIFDPEGVWGGEHTIGLMKSGLISRDTLMALAESNIYMIGEAVRSVPDLETYGANSGIQDAIDLANHIAEGRSPHQFYAEKYEAWQNEVKAREDRLADMHRIDMHRIEKYPVR